MSVVFSTNVGWHMGVKAIVKTQRVVGNRREERLTMCLLVDIEPDPPLSEISKPDGG
jgi:hypothetical protein